MLCQQMQDLNYHRKSSQFLFLFFKSQLLQQCHEN